MHILNSAVHAVHENETLYIYICIYCIYCIYDFFFFLENLQYYQHLLVLAIFIIKTKAHMVRVRYKLLMIKIMQFANVLCKSMKPKKCSHLNICTDLCMCVWGAWVCGEFVFIKICHYCLLAYQNTRGNTHHQPANLHSSPTHDYWLLLLSPAVTHCVCTIGGVLGGTQE